MLARKRRSYLKRRVIYPFILKDISGKVLEKIQTGPELHFRVSPKLNSGQGRMQHLLYF